MLFIILLNKSFYKCYIYQSLAQEFTKQRQGAQRDLLYS